MKKLFVVPLILALVFAAARLLPVGQPEAAPQEVNGIIIDYLDGAASRNFEKALSVLQGEALVNARANIGAPWREGRLVEAALLGRVAAGRYEVVDVRAVTAAFAPEGDELDELYYRFYIEGGRIFKVEPIAPLYRGDFSVADRMAELTVASYFELVEKNRWDEALALLTGRAKSAGRKTAAGMPRLEISFEGLNLATIGENAETSFVEARYAANGNKIKALFILKNVRGAWLIEQIIIVEQEELR